MPDVTLAVVLHIRKSGGIMAKKRARKTTAKGLTSQPLTPSFNEMFPTIARWISQEEGWVELGADHYSRSASDDIGEDAVAYTTRKAPSEVARELGDAWQPADEFVDASGVYLRYADDAVVILPLAVGSLILVEKLSTAYPRYHGIVGGFWGWGRGASLRGGGPGAGK